MRLNATFLAGFACGAAVFAAGWLAGGARVAIAQAADATPRVETADVVRTSRLEIVDELGTARVVLGTNAFGGALSVRDRMGGTVLVASAVEAGGAALVLQPEPDAPRLVLRATGADRSLRCEDADGRPRAAIADTPAGPESLLAAENGARVALAATGAGGSVVTEAAGGGELVRLSVDDTGGGLVRTAHARTNATLVSIGATVGRHGQVRTMGPEGDALVLLTSSDRGEGQVYTLGEDGRPLVALATRASGPSLRLFGKQGAPMVSIETEVDVESDEEQGTIGVWRQDGSGRSFRP